jgi:hypothetical protein
MKNFIMVAVAGVLCAGCAANAKSWNRPNSTAAQIEADQKICAYEAQLSIGPGQQTQVYGANMGGAIGAGIGDGIANAIRTNQLELMCMEARGYRLTEAK